LILLVLAHCDQIHADPMTELVRMLAQGADAM